MVAHDLGVSFDSRTPRRVIQDMAANGVDAVPGIYPAFVALRKEYESKNESLLPLGGVSEKITINGNESGEYAIYLSDRYGFNNPDTEWDDPQIESLLVGDSFTHGDAVQPGEDLTSRIRFLTGKAVINLGMSGSGPLIELAILKEYAEWLRPKRVFWLYYEGNDLVDNLENEKNVPVLMRYLEKNFSQGLLDKQDLINEKLQKIIKDEQEAYAMPEWLVFTNIRQLFQSAANAENILIDPLFSKIMSLAKVRTEAWGGKLYFIYLPDFDRYSNTIANHDLHRKKAEVIHLVKELGIPVIDIHEEVFSRHPDPLSLFPFRIFGHYTAEGYHQIAESVIRKVR